MTAINLFYPFPEDCLPVNLVVIEEFRGDPLRSLSAGFGEAPYVRLDVEERDAAGIADVLRDRLLSAPPGTVVGLDDDVLVTDLSAMFRVSRVARSMTSQVLLTTTLPHEPAPYLSGAFVSSLVYVPNDAVRRDRALRLLRVSPEWSQRLADDSDSALLVRPFEEPTLVSVTTSAGS